MKLFRSLVPLSFVVPGALLVGCASSGESPVKVAPVVTAETPFVDLQAVFLAKYPKASSVVDRDGYFSHAVRAYNDLAGAKVAAHDDFVKWCQLKEGVFFPDANRSSVPMGVRDAERAGNAMRTVNRIHQGPSWWNTNDEDESACVVADKTYLVFNVRDDDGSLAQIRPIYRTIAWLSPEDISTSGANALQVLEARRLTDLKQRDADARAAEEARGRVKVAEARKIAFLDNASKGTQLACSAQQHSNVDLNNLVLACNGLRVGFSEFPQHGWRITSQTIAPLEMNGVPQGRMVDLIAEKVR